jgi:hypothetical protein
MQFLKERLMRQALISPMYRGPSWRAHQNSSTFWRNVEIMRTIDEIIEVVNENDRYGPREVFEEPDADGRWACFVDEVHRQRQAAVRASTPANTPWELGYKCQERYLADTCRFGEPDYDSKDDGDVVRCSVGYERRDAEQAGSSARSGFHGPGSNIAETSKESKGTPIRPGPSTLSQSSPPEPQQIHNDENYRPTEVFVARSFFDKSGWSEAPDDSESSEDDEEAETEEAESDRILKLFEDFPTCVERTERAAPLDEEYGAAAMRDPASQWTAIEGYKLPRRIREHLADLSISDAQACPSSRGPDAALDSDAHRWLFTTPHHQFVFDMLTMNMWYRGRQPDPSRRAGPPHQPV